MFYFVTGARDFGIFAIFCSTLHLGMALHRAAEGGDVFGAIDPQRLDCNLDFQHTINPSKWVGVKIEPAHLGPNLGHV